MKVRRLFGQAAAGIAALCLSCVAGGPVRAEDDAAKGIEKYREMLSDPFANPGYLWVDSGEALWKKARGSKNVSLETCDLGEGPGKLEGAYAKLPRYFADVDRVMDLEARLLHCMETIQGFDTAEIRKKPFASSNSAKILDMEALVVFIANKSSGQKFDVKLTHAKEKEAFALGEALFYRRSSLMDFSCATCHGEVGLRIRLQDLPAFDDAALAQKTMGAWPTYRVSQANVRTMQHRMWDCYWQMRMPDVGYTSDVTISLITYLTKKADGGVIDVPTVKR